jgi:condensin complex subunit 2
MGLDIVAALPERDSKDPMVSPISYSLMDPTEGWEFGQVIDNLQKSHPQDKMAEMSTSFCFICLLHLVNEQGLKLESSTSKDDTNREDAGIERRVGDIWGLKVMSPSDCIMPKHAYGLGIDLS